MLALAHATAQALPAIYFELDYTLADTRTQFYVGNQTADYLRFDLETTLETQLGLRQEIGRVGTLSAGLRGAGIFKRLPPGVERRWATPRSRAERRG